MAPVGKCSDTSDSSKKQFYNNSSCKECKKRVIKGILCVKCNFWFHERCAKVNLKYVNDDSSWSCSDCVLNERENLLNTINSKDEIITLLNNDIETLRKEIEILTQEKTKLLNEKCLCISENSETVTRNNRKNNPLQNVKRDVQTEKSAIDDGLGAKINLKHVEPPNKHKWTAETYRYKGRKNLESAGNDFLIIGDSLIKNVTVPNAEIDVRPGISLYQLNNHLRNLQTKKHNASSCVNINYKGVFIHVGTNSLRYSGEEEIVNEARNLIRTAKTMYPASKLILSGILHRRSKLKDVKFKDTSSLTVRIISKFIWCISTWRNAVIVIISTAVAYYVSENDKIPFILTGRIEPGLPTVTPPPFSTSFDNTTLSFGDMCSYLGSGLAVVPIVAILGNVAIAKAFSNGEMLDATQEMITLGLCNIVGSFFRSMPVNGSFSRSAVNNSSGVRTQMGGLYTGILVIMALSLLTPHFYYIPKATLSSVIICAVIFMIEVDILPSLWRSNKRDLIPLFVTFIACLWLGVEIGIVIGIAVDIAILLYFNARPRVTVEKLKCPPAGPEYLLVRPGAGLLFPAVDFLRDAVAKASANCAEENLPVVIDCQHVQHADFTAARGIRALAADLSRHGHHCVFHRLRPDVSDVLGVTDTQCSSTEEELHTILQGLYDTDATVLQIKDPDNSSSQITLVSNHNTTKL